MTTTISTPSLQALVLAAGKSSRFNTGKTKLLEKICGQEMALYAPKLLQSMNIPVTMIVGFQKELVRAAVVKNLGDSITFVEQEQQQGTGHAIMCSRSTWKADHILIMNGDMPLVTKDIITDLYTQHSASNAAISFVIAHNSDPSVQGYGRVIKEGDTTVAIVEAKEFKGDSHQHCCINAGIYLVRRDFLQESIDAIERSAHQEFYFTDIVKIAHSQQRTITTTTASFDHIRGINTFHELWIAEQIKRSELIKHWMDQGVHFSVAQNVHIDLGVTIGSGTKIGCGVHLIGTTHIGAHCTIHEFSSVENSTVGDHTQIYSHCLLKDSHVGSHAKIGPFAHVHRKTHIGDKSVIGNFVEVKQSTIGNASKAKHLAYLGDAHIGSKVNIGAGTIICNHNGITKSTTTIHDHAYIGSNSTIIAPVTVGEAAFTAAGSVITDDVPAHALALGRARQVNKEGYAQKLRQRAQEAKEQQENNSLQPPINHHKPDTQQP
jgi:bifunctional UDP-N-acetylglucosamine pyrophosphorylase/glucosamine-1-phosphate N-acetyltransferase